MTRAGMIITALIAALAMGSTTDAAPRGNRKPSFGGTGGFGVGQQCRPGSFVIGFNARIGDWMDRIQAVCAPWDANRQTFGPEVPLEWFGRSNGGRRIDVRCSRDQVVTSLKLSVTIEQGRAVEFIRNAIVTCARPHLLPNSEEELRLANSRSVPNILSNSVCDRGWGVIGIHGRAGNFVDRLGIDCEEVPRPSPTGGVDDAQTRVELPRQPPPPPAPTNDNPYKDMPPPGPSNCSRVNANQIACPFPQIRDVYGNYLPLDYCRVWAGECGKPAADAYCRSLGSHMGDAHTFNKAEDIGRQRPTVVISNRQKCKGAHCDGFYIVVCNRL
jgi:hypothetical protein